MPRKNAARVLMSLTFFMATSLARASGIPTIDVAAVLESARQTAQLVRQYQTQLQQYELMLRNSANPTTFNWDQAQQTMARLRDATDTMRRIQADVRSVDAYVAQFGDLSAYQDAKRRTAGASAAAFGSKAQQAANGAALRAIDIQQSALEDDARQLARLQGAAQRATGQLQAVQFANQFASQQSMQLLQLRSLLSAQLQALAVQQAAQTDEQARRRTATESALRPNYRRSEYRSY